MHQLICEGYLIQNKACSATVKIGSKTELDLEERMRSYWKPFSELYNPGPRAPQEFKKHYQGYSNNIKPSTWFHPNP
jgi:hypothetical protein